jgi:iron complex transport system substrate-binding protein
MAAIRNGNVYEIPSTCILQPGPASLTEGVRQLHAVLARVAGVAIAPALRPAETPEGALL